MNLGEGAFGGHDTRSDTNATVSDVAAAEELIYDVEDDPLYVAVRGEP